MRPMKFRLLTFLIFFAAIPAARAAPVYPDGLWTTKKKDVVIRIASCGTDLCGAIVWMARDVKQTGLDGKPLCHARVLSGFRADGKDNWTGGTIARPDIGKTYSGTLARIDEDTLRLHGYLGVSAFGESKKLHRVPASGYPDCGGGD